MQYKEVEFKFDAQDINMSKFVDLMETFKIDKKIREYMEVLV